MTQAEGGEQGDPLMPLLFSIGIQGALEEVADAMRPDEQICDSWMMCTSCASLSASACCSICWQRHPSWIRRGSPNDQAGQNCAGASDRPRTHRRNPASGSTVGSIGHLPHPIVPLERAPCCQASLPQTGHIFSPTQGAMQGVVFAHAPTAPEFVVPPHLFRVLLLERMRLSLPITEATCGGCCHHLTLAVSTEPLAPGVEG